MQELSCEDQVKNVNSPQTVQLIVCSNTAKFW